MDWEVNESSFDLILSTIPQSHDANLYMPLLKRDGTYVVVGCLAPLDMSEILMKRKSVGSTLIGGIAETQEVLDICAEHGITATVQVVSIDDVNNVYKSVDTGEVPHRYVVDMSPLRGKTEDDSIAANVWALDWTYNCGIVVRRKFDLNCNLN